MVLGRVRRSPEGLGGAALYAGLFGAGRNGSFLCLGLSPGDDAMTGDTDKYLRPQDLKELGDDSLPQEGYMGFSIGARSAR